jgi:5-methylcytosine-specific restriction enzyme subunit McrC
LLPVAALLFERQAEPALRRGLLRGYRTSEETSLVVRGRVREADQLRRHYGMAVPVEIRHDDYSTDIAENQLLRTACERLLRIPFGVPGDVRTRLLRLKLVLADITPIGPGRDLPAWTPTRLNAHYHTALRMAELVLRGESVEHHPGNITINAFLFEMATVYEHFVTVALRHALSDRGGRCGRPDDLHLDELNSIRIKPDLVWHSSDGTPLAVVDAKYKAEKPDGFPDADLYQMLAYCTALRLSDGHLVYAKGDAPHGSHRVRNAGVTIHQHALDLDQPARTLLADVHELADLLQSSEQRVNRRADVCAG